jgi:UrcA family protein
MIRTLQAVGVAAAAVLAFGAPASAAEPTRTAVEVRYGDLNLATEKGATTLLRRIDRAAREACGLDPWQRGFVRAGQRACYAEAVGKAVGRVDAPMVTQVYAAREGRRAVFASR